MNPEQCLLTSRAHEEGESGLVAWVSAIRPAKTPVGHGRRQGLYEGGFGQQMNAPWAQRRVRFGGQTHE